MTVRHAAALALVGWYLMVPPASGISSDPENLPLSEWQTVKGFDERNDCEMAALGRKGMAQGNVLQGKEWQYKAPRDPRFYAQCIASDDPRLKEPSK